MNSTVQPFQAKLLPLKNIDWEAILPYIGEVHRSVSNFDSLVKNLPNPELLIAPLETREALDSSKIEGTQASLQEVFEYEAGSEQKENKKDDFQEVIAYRKALNYAYKNLEKLSFSAELIRKTHKILLQSNRGMTKQPGIFRTNQVYIGSGGLQKKVTYMPPKASNVPALIANLEKYVNRKEKDILVQLAIIHAQFEIIHPFQDGNGRVGRIMLPLFLYYKKVIHKPYFYLSTYFEKNRNKYYSTLNAISKKEDWKSWIIYFLEGVKTQSIENAQKAQSIMNLKEEMLQIVSEATHSQYSARIVDYIITKPVFQGTQFRDSAKIPKTSTYNLLSNLVAKKIITKISAGKGRSSAIYLFKKLLQILE